MQKARRSQALVQLDLFERRPNRPLWNKLPLEIQKTVTSLLTRMLHDHWKRETHKLKQEKTNE